MTHTPRLDDLLKPGQDLPDDKLIIEKALEILNFSPHGQQLVNMVEKEGVEIKIIATPQPTEYLPETRLAYIGYSKNNPMSPSHFIMALTALLREAQQELAGVKLPGASGTKEEHVKMSMAKYEDKLWYKCTVACELDSLDMFTEYKFLDELRKMGHNEGVDLFLKQEQKQGG